MTAPRITAETISYLRGFVAIPRAMSWETIRSLEDCLDALESAYAELDRLSAQDGEVPEEPTEADLDDAYAAYGCRYMRVSVIHGYRLALARVRGIRPAPPHPDTVGKMVSAARIAVHEGLSHHETPFLVPSETLRLALVAMRDTIRAQAQLATEPTRAEEVQGIAAALGDIVGQVHVEGNTIIGDSVSATALPSHGGKPVAAARALFVSVDQEGAPTITEGPWVKATPGENIGDLVARAKAQPATEDGPGEEDGPWASGWEQRSTGTGEIKDGRPATEREGA